MVVVEHAVELPFDLEDLGVLLDRLELLLFVVLKLRGCASRASL